MTQPAYQTRAEAEGPPAEVFEEMCRASYESTRPPASGRPTWEKLEEYKRAVRTEVRAAIKAAEALGYRMVKS